MSPGQQVSDRVRGAHDREAIGEPSESSWRCSDHERGMRDWRANGDPSQVVPNPEPSEVGLCPSIEPAPTKPDGMQWAEESSEEEKVSSSSADLDFELCDFPQSPEVESVDFVDFIDEGVAETYGLSEASGSSVTNSAPISPEALPMAPVTSHAVENSSEWTLQFISSSPGSESDGALSSSVPSPTIFDDATTPPPRSEMEVESSSTGVSVPADFVFFVSKPDTERTDGKYELYSVTALDWYVDPIKAASQIGCKAKGAKRTCLVCDAEFPNKRKFTDHFDSHWGHMKCGLCEASRTQCPDFRTRDNCVRHIRLQHPETHQSVRGDAPRSKNGRRSVPLPQPNFSGLSSEVIRKLKEVPTRKVTVDSPFRRSYSKYRDLTRTEILRSSEWLRNAFYRLVEDTNPTLTEGQKKEIERTGKIPYGTCTNYNVAISVVGRAMTLWKSIHEIQPESMTPLQFLSVENWRAFIHYAADIEKVLPKTITNYCDYLRKLLTQLRRNPEFVALYDAHVTALIAQVSAWRSSYHKLVTRGNPDTPTLSTDQKWLEQMEKGGIMSDKEHHAFARFLLVNFRKFEAIFEQVGDSLQDLYDEDPIHITHFLLLAQSICYWLFAMAMLGQRTQINVNFWKDGLSWNKDSGELAYRSRSEKRGRNTDETGVPKWLLIIYKVQVKYIRPILYGRRPSTIEHESLWVTQSGREISSSFKTDLNHTVAVTFNSALVLSESRSWRRLAWTLYFAGDFADFRQVQPGDDPDFVPRSGEEQLRDLETQWNVEAGTAKRYYNRSSNIGGEIRNSNLVSTRIFGEEAPVNSLDLPEDEELTEIAEDLGMSVRDDHPEPKTRDYIHYDRDSAEFLCFNKEGQLIKRVSEAEAVCFAYSEEDGLFMKQPGLLESDIGVEFAFRKNQAPLIASDSDNSDEE